MLIVQGLILAPLVPLSRYAALRLHGSCIGAINNWMIRAYQRCSLALSFHNKLKSLLKRKNRNSPYLTPKSGGLSANLSGGFQGLVRSTPYGVQQIHYTMLYHIGFGGGMIPPDDEAAKRLGVTRVIFVPSLHWMTC